MKSGGVRVDSLDHLRGVLAVSIMIYHYIAWSFPGWMSPGSLVSVLGYYGVSAFFVISGASLSLAYSGRMNSASDMYKFFVRRFFRIAPLYWVAITLTIAVVVWYKGSLRYLYSLSAFDVFANYSLAFSIFGPSKSLVTGGWSIGNEVFFYLFFPFLFVLMKRSAGGALFALLASASMLVFWAFVCVPMSRDAGVEAWGAYTSNPNQVLFFVAGMAIGAFSKPGSMRAAWSYVGLVFSMVVLFSVSVENRPSLVEGWWRIILSVTTLLLVFCVYQVNWSSANSIGRVLSFFGAISYSLYLLHPIVRLAFISASRKIELNQIGVILASVALTVAISWLSYKFIELPGMRFGSSIGRRQKSATTAAREN